MKRRKCCPVLWLRSVTKGRSKALATVSGMRFRASSSLQIVPAHEPPPQTFRIAFRLNPTDLTVRCGVRHDCRFSELQMVPQPFQPGPGEQGTKVVRRGMNAQALAQPGAAFVEVGKLTPILSPPCATRAWWSLPKSTLMSCAGEIPGPVASECRGSGPWLTSLRLHRTRRHGSGWRSHSAVAPRRAPRRAVPSCRAAYRSPASAWAGDRLCPGT